MKLARYLDGGPSTPLRALMVNHSCTGSVKVPKHYEDELLDHLSDFTDSGDEPKLPDYKSGYEEPVPFSCHVDELSDRASDMVGEEFPGEVGAFWQELLELCQESVGMDTVYLMGDRT